MTNKQERFVAEYLIDMNCTQAAIRAGYSQKTAYSIGNELLRNPEISQAITQARREREERTEITADYVLRNLKEIAERCMQARPVIVKGEQATDERGNNLWTFDAKNAIRSLELLGKNLGLFVERKEVTTDLGTTKTLADLMMEELL